MINSLTSSLLRENSPRDATAQQATLNRATEYATSSQQADQKAPFLLDMARNRLRNKLATTSQNNAQQAQSRASEDDAVKNWLAHIEETDPQIIADVIQQCHADPEANEYFLGRAKEVFSPLQLSNDTNTPPEQNNRSTAHPGGLA